MFTKSELEQWRADGYVIVKSLFDQDEIELLFDTARNDPRIEGGAIALEDAEGGKSKLTGWNNPGDDLYGMFARCERLVNRMENLLGGEVYHWHSKMMLKEPLVGGAWEWHQDYGYWYNMGCLYPTMASCMIPLDRASKENGCLQVLKGSQRLGRIEHSTTGDQTGADLDRVKVAMKNHDLVYCEVDPGDAIFFHGNLLHRSDQNRSPHSRWTLISCYNTADNSPFKTDAPHPAYMPLVKVPDSAIRETGKKGLSVEAENWARKDE